MRATAIAAAAVAVALGGCGGDDSAATKASKFADKVEATAAKGDSGALCDDLFTDSLRKRVESTEKASCEKIVMARLVPALASFEVGSVQLQDDDKRAVVSITDKNGASDKLYLAKDGDSWKLDAVLKPGSGTLTQPAP